MKLIVVMKGMWNCKQDSYKMSKSISTYNACLKVALS